MSAAGTRAETRAAAWPWLVLVKPRIGAMVALSATVGGLLGGGRGSFPRAFEAALWIACTAASASVFNQVLERDTDGLMQRTARRPLVTGAIGLRDAILFGALLGALGVVALAVRFNLLSALLALATIAAYTLVYTPLKRCSTLNTVAGAVPGAMPPLLGYAALSGQAGGLGAYLFAVQFAWQFPHFLAIAWIYRVDYARAGLRMLPAVEGSASMAGRQSVAYALTLLPLALFPAAQGQAGLVFSAAALLLGLVYLGASAAFAWRQTDARARALLRVSLVYLPLLQSAILVDPVVRLLSPIP